MLLLQGDKPIANCITYLLLGKPRGGGRRKQLVSPANPSQEQTAKKAALEI